MSTPEPSDGGGGLVSARHALVPVTSWIFGHIFSFQPALPVTARMILPSCARMKRGVALGRDLPSSLSRNAAFTHLASAGQDSSTRISDRLAGWTIL